MSTLEGSHMLTPSYNGCSLAASPWEKLKDPLLLEDWGWGSGDQFTEGSHFWFFVGPEKGFKILSLNIAHIWCDDSEGDFVLAAEGVLKDKKHLFTADRRPISGSTEIFPMGASDFIQEFCRISCLPAQFQYCTNATFLWAHTRIQLGPPQKVSKLSAGPQP